MAKSLFQLCSYSEELHPRVLSCEDSLTAEIDSVVPKDRKSLATKMRWALRDKNKPRATVERVKSHIEELELLYTRPAPAIDVLRQIRVEERLDNAHQTHQHISMDLAIGRRRFLLPVGPEEEVRISFRAAPDNSTITGCVLLEGREFTKLPSSTTAPQGSIVEEDDENFGIHSETVATPLGSDLHSDDLDADHFSGRDTYLPDVGHLNTGTIFENSATASDPDKWFRTLHRYTHALFQGLNLFANLGRRRVRVAVLDSGFTFARMGDDQQEANQWLKKRMNRCIDYQDFTGQYEQRWSDGDEGYHGTNCASLLLQISPDVDVYIANVISQKGARCWQKESQGDSSGTRGTSTGMGYHKRGRDHFDVHRLDTFEARSRAANTPSAR